MVTRFNLLYSSSAVRRMLGLGQSSSVQIREFFRVIWVWVEGQRPTFISKQSFKAHFVAWRKGAAASLATTQDRHRRNIYRVRNVCKGSVYQVQLGSGYLLCSCEDFKNQAQFFGRACCKHGYAVLAQLGHGSLSDYIAASA